MKKSIKELEIELKKKTGEDTLPEGDLIKAKNTFNSALFLKLAKEMQKIFAEDEHNTNSRIKSL